MADKRKKKKEPAANLGGGVSTKSYKPKQTKRPPSEQVGVGGAAAKGKLLDRLSGKAKKIIVIALIVAILVGAGVPIIVSIVRNHRINSFDYIKSDLSEYVDFPATLYKDYPLLLGIAKPHSKNPDGTGVSDVEIAILSMLAEDKGGKTIGGMTSSSTELCVGDDVYIWYRGFVIKDGKEVDVTSLMNFYKDEANVRAESNALTLGEGTFGVAGIEGAMIGLNTGDYQKFEKITEGEVKASQVVYISCERIPVGGSAADKQTGSCVRIDLQDPENSQWVPILEGAAIGSEVDDLRITVDGTEYDYSKVKVEFATECESSSKVLTLEGYAPYDYSITQLQNETIYVDIYFAGVQKRNDWHNKGLTEYTLDFDWNDEYISSKLEDEELLITREELDKYDGASLTEKYEAYVLEKIWDNYEENLKQMTETVMWQYYLDRAVIKEYPKLKVDAVYKEYYDDVIYQYEKSGGQIYNIYTGENEVCANIDEYAIIYLSLQYEEDKDWKAHLTRLSESLIAERLVMFYIMQAEELTPTAAEFNEKFEALKQEYLDEYIKQDSTDTSKFTEEEYKEYVEECKEKLFDYYDDDYFTELTYYELVVTDMIRYAKVYTLDDIPARDRFVFDVVTNWI